FFSSRRRHTRSKRDWSSDVCSSDLIITRPVPVEHRCSLNYLFPWSDLLLPKGSSKFFPRDSPPLQKSSLHNPRVNLPTTRVSHWKQSSDRTLDKKQYAFDNLTHVCQSSYHLRIENHQLDRFLAL